MRSHAKASSAGSTQRPAAGLGRTLWLVVVASLLSLAFAGAASAAVVVNFFGGTGTAGGSFGNANGGPGGVAVNQEGTGGAAAGDVYVVDRGNNRVQQFTSAGAFVRAFGQNVVATGPGNAGTSEVQKLTVKASSGTFALTFTGATASEIPYDASAAELESKLNALSTIANAGGSVSVSGGPGDATGSSPYLITFGGSLAGTNVPEIVLNPGGLGIATGTELSCGTTTVAESISYRWLRNGGPIGGANASTYTTVPADAGAAIQCQVTAINSNAGATQISVPAANGQRVASPYPSSAPPATSQSAAPAPTVVGGGSVEAGKKLSCATGTWAGGPSFSYQWYRNGVALAGNGAATSEYTVQAGDVAIPSSFQCAVTATNPSGSAGLVSSNRTTTPAPSAPVTPVADAAVPSVTTIATETGGVSAFEICNAAADVCRAGEAATGAGAMNNPQGVAIDQGTGNIYVTDQGNRRVDVYSATGAFQGAFGWGIDTGAAAFEFCTTASLCEAFVVGGANAGQFGAAVGYVAVAPAGSPNAGHVYVANKGSRRVDQFEPTLTGSEVTGMTFVRAWGWGVDNGASEFQQCTAVSECQAPNTSSPTSNPGQFASNQPQALTVDNNGNVYTVESSGNNRVQKFSATGNPAAFSAPAQLQNSPGPVDIAHNPATNRIFGLKGCDNVICPGVVVSGEQRVFEVEPGGPLVETHAQNAGITSATGVAAATGGNVYVSTNLEAKRGVFILSIPSVPPTASVEPPSPLTSHSATLRGKVNPKGFETAYHFEFSKDGGSTWQNVPAFDVKVGAGEEDVPVSQAVTGLVSGHTYFYRIFAEKPFAAGAALTPPIAFTTPASSPSVATFTTAVSSSKAVLGAEINPENQATTYHFEYGLADCASSPCTSVPVPDAGIGSGGTPVKVSKEITGLQPDTTYHFRVVATNGSGVTEGPDTTFRTYEPFTQDTSCENQEFRYGKGAFLPNCRAYEMVSPIDKNGADVSGPCSSACLRLEVRRSSTDGNKFTFSSYRAFGDSPSGQYSSQYLATRESSGWSTHGISPPQGPTIYDPEFTAGELFEVFTDFSPDLSKAWVTNFNQTPLTPDGIVNKQNLYQRDNTTGTYTAISTVEPMDGGGYHKVEDASLDGSHVVFSATAKLTADAHSASPQTQLYERTGGETRLVSVLPDGTATPNYAALGGPTGSSFERGASLDHAISDDGSRIFWSATSGGIGPGALYVRIDGQTTVQLSAGAAQFWTASSDGSRAIFSGGSDYSPLFEFDVDAETATLIAPEVKGVLGASDDLSYLYFVSKADLAPGATAGQRNLYVRHEGTMTFIATLAGIDVQEPGAESTGKTIVSGYDVVSPMTERRASRVTPDGIHAAFQSVRSLTGYDNTDANNGEPNVEVFIYDAERQELTCASCNPSGARPAGQPLQDPFRVGDAPANDNGRPERRWTAAWLSTPEWPNYASHALSDDGNRLFFNSFDALLPQDNNGKQDVYQWEAEGSGDCQKAGGCIDLISSGDSTEKSEFVDATADGSSVFFTTESSLVPQDPGLIDIYAARVGGGFPPPPAPDSSCVGDACQNVPAPPNDPTPASAGFRGAGDPAAGSGKPRRSCKARNRRAGKKAGAAERKRLKRCRRANRRAAR